MNRIALFGFLVFAAIAGFILIVIPRIRADAQAKLEHTLVREPYRRVKQGEQNVIVMRRELLELLADDPQCVDSVREINFSSFAFKASDAELLSKMGNLSTINFYCCKNADLILPACSKLPLTSVGFELTRFSPESIRQLGAVPPLAYLSVEQNLGPFEVAAMKQIPNTVTIRSSFPMDAYD